jgi:formate-dependent nitrite reductase membrane component NrfD
VPLLAQPTWNHEIAAYFYFGGMSAGAFALGAVADLAGGPRLRGTARTAHAVAFLAMLPCPPLLIDDLGVPSRFHHMLRIFKPSSPMNLGAWTLTVHGGMSTILALRLLAEDGKLPLIGTVLKALPETPLVAAGLPSALTLAGYTGVLLGTTSVPAWSGSPLLGGLFTASALSSGAAAVALAEAVRGGSAEAREAMRPLHAAFGGAELAMLAGFVATSGPAVTTMATGKAKWLIAGAGLAAALGVALEVAGPLTGLDRRLLSGAAAAATLVGGALLRWGLIRAGHESARDRERTLEATKPSRRAPGWGGT